VYNRESANPDFANTMSVSIGLGPEGPWREVYRCNGRFGGVLTNTPLVVAFDMPIEARYVRLQLHETTIFHLDEVEVYAPVAADDPMAARIVDVFASRVNVPEEFRESGIDVMNSEAWNWAVFRGQYKIDAQRLHTRWFGPKPRFILDPEVPFDGEIKTLRIHPAGGTGNIFYDIVNACLIARAVKCSILEVPDIVGGFDRLPVVVDGLRIERKGSLDANRPVLEASFYWPRGFEPVVGDYGTDFLYDTIRRFVRPIFAKFSRAADESDGSQPGDDVLVMHFRGGELFEPGGNHPWYVQPPASFYIKAINFALISLDVSAVHLVFQDHLNPCVDIVMDYLIDQSIPFTSQSSSLFDDIVTLMHARHLAVPYGTFCEFIGLLSERVRTYIGFRAISTQTPIAWWAQSHVEDVLRVKGVRIFLMDDPDQGYIEPQTWCNSPTQIELMRSFPAEKLRLLECVAPTGEEQSVARLSDDEPVTGVPRTAVAG
jgi:hypothetical protein